MWSPGGRRSPRLSSVALLGSVSLGRLIRAWTPPLDSSAVARFDYVLLKVATALCFFGFFRSGEITAPTASAFNERVHLAWGDVAAADASPPASVRVRLKRSKCDQVGAGVDVYVGRTGTDADAAVHLGEGALRGGILHTQEWHPAHQVLLRGQSPPDPPISGSRPPALRQAQFPDRRSHGSCSGRPDSVIQALGRWNSTAFRRYIRVRRVECWRRFRSGLRPQAAAVRPQVISTTVRPRRVARSLEFNGITVYIIRHSERSI